MNNNTYIHLTLHTQYTLNHTNIHKLTQSYLYNIDINSFRYVNTLTYKPDTLTYLHIYKYIYIYIYIFEDHMQTLKLTFARTRIHILTHEHVHTQNTMQIILFPLGNI